MCAASSRPVFLEELRVVPPDHFQERGRDSLWRLDEHVKEVRGIPLELQFSTTQV